MDKHEIRHRALRGALTLVARGAVLRVASFAGWIVLAAMLGPSAFGALAFGLAILAATAVLADGGLAAGLIRQPETPTRQQLGAALSLQIVIAIGLVATVAPIGAMFGEAGRLTAILMLGLPVSVLKVPAVTMAERQLRYAPMVAADFAETIVFFGLAIGAVAAGAGVTGVAVAGASKGLAGAAAVLVLVPEGRIVPRWDWHLARPALDFGIRFQGVPVIALAREQLLNAALLALSGPSALGLWSLAFRVMQLPFLVFQALWRVSYPAMSRLREAGGDLGPLLGRLTSAAGLATSVIAAPTIAGAMYLIPAVMGAGWQGAAEVIPVGMLGLVLSGPISVAAAGFLYADGRATDVMSAAALGAVVWVALTVPLASAYGALAGAIGWVAGALVEALCFTWSVRRRAGVNLLTSAMAPAAATLTAGAVGLAAGSAAGGGLSGGLVAMICACLCMGVLVCTLMRRRAMAAADLVRGRRLVTA